MDFDWDRENISHLRRHRVASREAEEVLQNDPLIAEFQQYGWEERLLVLGQTNTGRLLAVVYTERENRSRVVTAYPMTKRLEEIYFRER